MYKFNNLLTPVATTKNAIPFINCHALEPFTIFIYSYARKTTIVISNIKDTNFIGYSCKLCIYAKIFCS